MKTFGFLLLFMLLAGCVSRPTADQLAAADYGPPPTSVDAIRTYFAQSLKDPYTAQYRFGEPVRGYLSKPPIVGGSVSQYGWFVDVGVNARNSFGAYTGERLYRFFYRSGEWREIAEGWTLPPL